MGTYFVQKRSFREVRRFQAVDQDARTHTVVERVAVSQGVGASGCIVDTKQGRLCFYSATTGDALTRQADGSLQSSDGKLRLQASA